MVRAIGVLGGVGGRDFRGERWLRDRWQQPTFGTNYRLLQVFRLRKGENGQQSGYFSQRHYPALSAFRFAF
jgi:hypothetical protein